MERSANRRVVRGVALLLAAVASTAATTRLEAQLGELRPGARVRLRAPGAVAGQVEGVVTNWRADTVVVAPGGAPVPRAVFVPAAAITEAAVYRERSRRAAVRRGAALGALVGFGLGVLDLGPGYAACVGRYCGSGHRAGGIAAFTAIGAAVGARLGASAQAGRWERLTLPTGAVVATTPGPRATP